MSNYYNNPKRMRKIIKGRELENFFQTIAEMGTRIEFLELMIVRHALEQPKINHNMKLLDDVGISMNEATNTLNEYYEKRKKAYEIMEVFKTTP